jgi:hypothetical protein
MRPILPKLEPFVVRRVPLAGVIGFLVTPAAAAESAAGAIAGAAPGILMALLVALLLSAVIVMGLVLWSRKQEHLHDMMLFCMKY